MSEKIGNRNLTSALFDLFSAWLHDHYGLTVLNLVWLNAGTTALVLLAVPFCRRR